MIIQRLAGIFINNDRCVHNTAKALDYITAVALLTFGLLGANGMIALGCSTTYAFIGAGVVYSAVMLLDDAIDACRNKPHCHSNLRT